MKVGDIFKSKHKDLTIKILYIDIISKAADVICIEEDYKLRISLYNIADQFYSLKFKICNPDE